MGVRARNRIRVSVANTCYYFLTLHLTLVLKYCVWFVAYPKHQRFFNLNIPLMPLVREVSL